MKKILFLSIITLLSGCAHHPGDSFKKQDTMDREDWSSLILKMAENKGLGVIEHEYMLTIMSNEDVDLGKWASRIRTTYPEQLKGIEHHTRWHGENMVMDWFPSKL